MGVTPIFLFSLPRSGSTLLHRLIATSPDVASRAEPWLLLPVFYARRPAGIVAEYRQFAASAALTDFVDSLPGKSEDYDHAVRAYALALYEAAATSGERYFLDKTPRYAFIIDDVVRAFPDARFVFLWRQPLAVAASIIETWGAGHWNLHVFRNDLLRSPPALATACRQLAGRAHALRFEDMIADPAAALEPLFQFLDLDFDPAVLSEFESVELPGRMGDKTGVDAYREISEAPVDRWTRTLANPFRRRWARWYVDRLGDSCLETMGYDRSAIHAQIDARPNQGEHLFGDMLRWTTFGAVRTLGGPLVRRLDRYVPLLTP